MRLCQTFYPFDRKFSHLVYPYKKKDAHEKLLASFNGRRKSRLSTTSKAPVTLDVPSFSKDNKCLAELYGATIEGKSRFVVNDTMIKINQHTTKCVFDDFSYIMFKVDDFTVYNKFGQVVSYGKHLNKTVLNAKGKK